jgi:hypothetical protein
MDSKRTSSFGRILTLATDARAVTWPVVITCAVLSVLIHLAPNGNTVEGSVWVRIVLAILGYLPGLGVIFLAVLLVRKVHSKGWSIAIMLTSYFVGGALRGLFLSLSFYSLGMADALNLDFRIPGSAIPFGLAIASATYAVSALDESKRRIASLRALQAELNEAVAVSTQKESDLRELTLSKIEENVSDQLATITSIKDSASQEELRSLAVEVVRPLSHSLAERVPVWEATQQESVRIRWADIFAQVRPELSLRPFLLTILSNATAVTAFFFFFGVATAIPLLLCTFVLLYASTRALQAFISRFTVVKNLFARSVLMTVLLMVASLPSGIVGDLIIRDTPDPTFILRSGLLIVPLFGWFIALGGAAQAESARLENDINAGIERLSWLKARLNLVNWFEQGEFARVLHGPVQSAINKGIIRLSQNNGESSRAEIIHTVREDIATALKPTLQWEGHSRSFDQLCADLALTWEGLSQIDFAISPAAKQALAADPACASLAWDIVHESCGNAIQHGKATWISVRITDPTERVLTVDVVNNGEAAEVESKPGMGSNMLDACTLKWSRERINEQTVLAAHLPVQA